MKKRIIFILFVGVLCCCVVPLGAWENQRQGQNLPDKKGTPSLSGGSYTRIGKTTYGPHGDTYTHIGNTTHTPNGT